MITVAYLGPEHTNTHVAARKRFGSRATYVNAPTVEDVFRVVEREEADYGVIPIENSLEGAVTHTLDRFIDFKKSPVTIHGEVEQQIHHFLVTHPGTVPKDIRLVFSHPQALAQCRKWLSQHLPYAHLRETNSTADAINSLLYERNTTHAAIGRQELAKEHKLSAICIPDDRENKTRFLIIGLSLAKCGARNKTSILMALKDRPGALYDALVPFKRAGINLTKIESRPSKKKAWEYFFFIDLEGHQSEPRVKRALRALKQSTLLLKVLGSYPITR